MDLGGGGGGGEHDQNILYGILKELIMTLFWNLCKAYNFLTSYIYNTLGSTKISLILRTIYIFSVFLFISVKTKCPYWWVSLHYCYSNTHENNFNLLSHNFISSTAFYYIKIPWSIIKEVSTIIHYPKATIIHYHCPFALH